MIEFFDEVQHVVHRADMCVWTVICAPFLVDVTSLEDSWEEVVGDADGGVGFSVLQ
jgi:hypothetical protein